METDKIIKENKKRLSELNSPYDPISGLGSPIEREKIIFEDSADIYMTKEMINKSKFAYDLITCGSFRKMAEILGVDIKYIQEFFVRERFKYDFEFWAALTIIVQNKETGEDFKFYLRKVQLILLNVLELMRINGVPIRIILLKARQWGGSTLIQVYMMWIQQIHKINWHLAVCAQDDGAAANIREMYLRAAKLYPKEIDKITFKPYAGTQKNIVNIERGGIIGVGSINNPDQFRSFNYFMIHISEAGVWEDTPKRTAKQLVQSLRSIVPNVPYSLEVVESTAKGVGKFFHDEWLTAESGKSGYNPVFIPFFKIDMYQKQINDYIEFINGMDEEDLFTWNHGGTLESIAWYNNFRQEKNYELIQMQEEFPRTPEEAFISTGQRIFPYTYISRVREKVQDPIAIGEIYPHGLTGKEALKNIEFHENKKGNLKIWRFPEPYVKIENKLFIVSNRYCGFGDIGGINQKADFSCLKIIDRFWMLYGENPETCALWHGHIDQDLFSWKCAQLGTWYNNMLFAIETNSLRKEKTNGDYFITVLDNIAPYYSNLYVRNNHESILKDFIPKYGFHTGGGNKDMIVTSLLGAFREEIFTEKDKDTLDECDFFERKKDGTMGAVQGKKDDRVIVTAGGYWLASKYMPPPILIPYDPLDKRKITNKIVGESTI